MNPDVNCLNWFEIPVTDMERAKHFYQVIFSIHMNEQVMGPVHMAFFPSTPGNGKVSGALAKADFYRPSHDGVVIYLNANPDLAPILEKVEGVGGRVIMPKTEISPEYGYMAVFIDTEGNRVALHSQQ